MFELFLKEWLPEAARSKNVVVLDARSSLVGKSDFKKAFSDRYFELDPSQNIVIDEAKGFFLTQKIPVVFMDSDTVKSSLKSFFGEVFNLKVIGVGDENVVHFVNEIPGWEVLEPRDEIELKQMVLKINSHFGPLYIHVI